MIYLGGRRFLKGNHKFQRARAAFNNHLEWDEALKRPIGKEVLAWGTHRLEWILVGGVEDSHNDLVKLHGVKKRSFFFELPYGKVSFYKCC
jgi:hypothetical protein